MTTGIRFTCRIWPCLESHNGGQFQLFRDKRALKGLPVKCVIFGGGGFIGSHVTDAFVARGHDVRVFDRLSSDTRNHIGIPSQIEAIHGDFFNEKDLALALSGVEVAVHLVTTTIPSSSNENMAYDVQTNLAGTLRMLDCALSAGVRKIVFASSGGTVYGRPTIFPIPENHPTEPLCSYGITKLAIEKYLQLYQHLYGLEYIILRLANPFGERQNPLSGQGAVTTFLAKVAEGASVTVWGDGHVRRDYFYVGDLVSAFVKAAEQSPRSKIFNIGSGSSLSINELLSIIRDVTGKNIDVVYSPSRKLDVPVNCLDTRLAGDELGWFRQTTITEGIARTWAWMNAGTLKD